MSNNLDELVPYVKYLALKLIDECNKQGISLKVVQTLRSFSEQQNLYEQGRTKPGKIVTNAKAGYSYHNYGLAFDICPIVDGKLNWNRSDLFNKIGEIGKSIGLEWGGDFKSIKDTPHFQYSGGVNIKRLLNGERPKYPNFDTNVKDDFKYYIDKLKLKNIINTPSYWLNNAIVGKNVKGEYVGGLIKKMAFLDEASLLNSAIEILKLHNVITTPDYWINNSVGEKMVNGEYINILIRRYVKNMGL